MTQAPELIQVKAPRPKRRTASVRKPKPISAQTDSGQTPNGQTVAAAAPEVSIAKAAEILTISLKEIGDRYLVTTPLNPQFTGKVCGVMFQQGHAVFSNGTLPKNTGYTVEEALRELRNLNAASKRDPSDPDPYLIMKIVD